MCIQGKGDFLDLGVCPKVDSVCAAKPGGTLVQWYTRDPSTTPPTETAAGGRACLYPGEAPAPPAGIDAVVVAEPPVVVTLREFQSQPLAAADIASQPRNFGLKNAHTNIYATASEQEFSFQLRRSTFRLKARPVRYEWRYGDGTTAATDGPGNPLPEGAFNTATATSHKYSATGDFQVGLRTYFDGDYSVDGGPWQPVAGQAFADSGAHLISVWRSVTNSVADDCRQNPRGVGCQPPGT